MLKGFQLNSEHYCESHEHLITFIYLHAFSMLTTKRIQNKDIDSLEEFV